MKKKDLSIDDINKKNWLNQEEVEKYTGMTRKTIIKLREEGTTIGGRLPFSKVNGAVRYNRFKIDKFFEQHELKETINI